VAGCRNLRRERSAAQVSPAGYRRAARQTVRQCPLRLRKGPPESKGSARDLPWADTCDSIRGMGAEAGPEWPTTLDVVALMAGGWRPTPFQEFIVKIHSRCDLACDYCYMYEMADQSWREQPRRMSREIAERTAIRIGEHARTHRLAGVGLVLHGGEPLLAGRDLISYLVTSVRAAAGTAVVVDVSVQTNAVGLDDSYLRLFDELGIRVGVSLDGAAEDHDRHRRFASGRGSYAAVAAGLRRLADPSYRHLFSGLLCTIDLRNDPIATYEALVAFGPPRIDFLLPHGGLGYACSRKSCTCCSEGRPRPKWWG